MIKQIAVFENHIVLRFMENFNLINECVPEIKKPKYEITSHVCF